MAVCHPPGQIPFRIWPGAILLLVNSMTVQTYRSLVADLEGTVERLYASDCPVLLGELTRLKALVSMRMMNCQSSPHDPRDNALLTITQVARRLAITKGRAYELARQGKFPTIRIGKYVRVDSGRLEAWINQNRDKTLDNDVDHRQMLGALPPKRKER
jgi:excisionase family DNA binding protein